ncbi:lipase-like PAD4 [Malania oleifera]|uniref:lipase-like PAD4 n=1 Tax=Malania oleifera TaxID=397392 RepID=UPI0025AEABED|nr:lipase-like PAD4 [Malania oleifera]
MEAEDSPFETSEMLAAFLASTPLMSESWRLCGLANAAAPGSFVTDQVEGVRYVAFSGIQTAEGGLDVMGFSNLARLDSAGNGIFAAVHGGEDGEGEEPVMVHAGMLHLFMTMYGSPTFQNQMGGIIGNSRLKSIIMTGHSIGGATASLAALWLLSYLHSISSSQLQVLCITFGSPLLGNGSLSRAILRARWGGNFCHVVSKHDIVPRLLFPPPLRLPLADQAALHFLHQFWQLLITSLHLGSLDVTQVPDQFQKATLMVFNCVMGHLREALAKAYPLGYNIRNYVPTSSSFWPFGNYFFCSQEAGAICLDNAAAIAYMLHLMFITSSASSSIEDHLRYGEYVAKISLQFLKGTDTAVQTEELPKSSYEAGLHLALQSSGIATEDVVAGAAKDCLKIARRLGRTPYLNSANLAISLSKITPYRAQIEWYKTSCDESEDQMGYYDLYKLRGASKKHFKVNMNRIKLAQFWNEVIQMLDTNKLPQDFSKRAKWVNASQFYKLLVEPLEIAEYYRNRMHRSKGHYIKYGRQRRFEVFDRWWRERKLPGEEENTYPRSKFASLTQDSCFWAKVEEAREWLENARRENDMMKLALIWENMKEFERYANRLIESKEVSRDVLAKNSSYSVWVEEWREFKSHSAVSFIC